MLLLAWVVFGRSQADDALAFLPEEEAELLKHRVEAFRKIPKEQRIPFLVREMRRMLSMRRRRLATATPEHLAELLAKEKPVVIEVILRALPSLLAHSVQAALPALRETQRSREPRPEVFSFVRWKLEEELQNSSVSALFRFEDLLGLQARELMTICDRMGARLFATALAGLPGGERQSFLDALPPDQRMLAQKACYLPKERHLQPSDARRLLELYGATADASLALRSAGARRIIRACLSKSAEFASKISRQYEGALGKLLLKWFEEEKGKQIRGDGGRADILEQLEFLAKRGFLERPLMLPKPKEVSVAGAKLPPRGKSPAPMGLGAARLAAPPDMKPSARMLPEKLPKPTPSKLARRPESTPQGTPQGVDITAARSPSAPAALSPPMAARRSAQAPPKTVASEKQAAPVSAAMAKRRLPPPAPGAVGGQRSALPPRRSREARLPASELPTGKSAVVLMSEPGPGEGGGGASGAAKAAVIRVPALQSVPRRRITGETGALKKPTQAGQQAGRAQQAGQQAGRAQQAGPQAGRAQQAGPQAGRAQQAGQQAGRAQQAGTQAGRAHGGGKPPRKG